MLGIGLGDKSMIFFSSFSVLGAIDMRNKILKNTFRGFLNGIEDCLCLWRLNGLYNVRYNAKIKMFSLWVGGYVQISRAAY